MVKFQKCPTLAAPTIDAHERAAKTVLRFIARFIADGM
jgi:hypothetical protein